MHLQAPAAAAAVAAAGPHRLEGVLLVSVAVVIADISKFPVVRIVQRLEHLFHQSNSNSLLLTTQAPSFGVDLKQ